MGDISDRIDKLNDPLLKNDCEAVGCETIGIAAITGLTRASVTSGTGASERSVDFASGSFLNDAQDVAAIDSAAGHDDDAVSGGLYQTGQSWKIICGERFAGGGQNTRSSRPDHVFERGFRICRLVEGPVKSYRKRMRQTCQSSCADNVNASIAMQNPEHNSIHAGFLRGKNVGAHDFKFVIGVAEIPSVRPDQGMDGNLHVASHRAHKAETGGDSAAGKISAKFYAIRSAAFRCKSMLHRFDADFHTNETWHVRRGSNFD
jgi:hypothetical protein